MAKSSNRISVNTFEKSLNKDNIIGVPLPGAKDVEVQVKRVLSLTDMLEFVDEVVGACVDVETGEYIPEAYYFAMRRAVLTHYTNIALPSSLEKQYAFLYQTEIFDSLSEVIDGQQYRSITKTIDKKIEYMLNIMSASATNKINDILTKFGDVAKLSEEMFSSNTNNTNGEDVSKFMNAITKLGELNADDVAKAVAESKILGDSKDG